MNMLIKYVYMSGKNMNIYFKEDVFQMLHEEIGKGFISSFINETITKRLSEIKEEKEIEQRKKIINYYKKISNDKEFQSDLNDCENISLESLKKNVSK
ncbi:MAG: hypothetical protein AM1032_000020 [Mycoplasmataceae bacterium]|nr:MAG: hypothetical protein AM1032_000020 [Mycoplasmataceae bacterium]